MKAFEPTVRPDNPDSYPSGFSGRTFTVTIQTEYLLDESQPQEKD